MRLTALKKGLEGACLNPLTKLWKVSRSICYLGSVATPYGDRHTVVVPDLLADPKWALFAEFVRPFGLRAGWSSPILGSNGAVLGTFANYYRQPRDPTPQDLEWVEMVKRSVAIAIERERFEKSRQRLISIVESQTMRS